MIFIPVENCLSFISCSALKAGMVFSHPGGRGVARSAAAPRRSRAIHSNHDATWRLNERHMLLFGWCDLSSVNNDISSVGLLMRRPQGHCPNFGCEELVGSHIGFLNKEENFKDEIQLSVSMFVFSRMLWQ